jgi:hypothetical protein
MTQVRAPLTHLFDGHLQYEDALEPVVQLRDAGELFGSGTGQATGARLNGMLRWCCAGGWKQPSRRRPRIVTVHIGFDPA